MNVVNSLADIRKNKRVRIPPKKREKKEEKIAGQLSLIFDDDEVDSYREWNSCVVVLINPDGWKKRKGLHFNRKPKEKEEEKRQKLARPLVGEKG